MTEEEAKTKWCPFARVALTSIRDGNVEVSETSCNRIHKNESLMKGGANCIGSACMAWRETFAYDKKPPKGMAPKPLYANGGYCGLAGKS